MCSFSRVAKSDQQAGLICAISHLGSWKCFPLELGASSWSVFRAQTEETCSCVAHEVAFLQRCTTPGTHCSSQTLWTQPCSTGSTSITTLSALGLTSFSWNSDMKHQVWSSLQFNCNTVNVGWVFPTRLQETRVGPRSAPPALMQIWMCTLVNTETLQVHPSVTGEEWGAQLLHLDTKWEATTSFLSLTTLCAVGRSETTRIATTHSKKKKKVNT